MGQTAILDGIRIASPCPASWDSMAGDDRARFCSECGKDVYNIAAMTAAEASALIAEREGRTCVRLYRRPDGTVLTADCPAAVATIRRGRLRKLAGLGVIGLALASSGVAALGFFGPRPDDPFPSGPAITLDDWIDWALIRIGWRTPRFAVTGKVVMGEPAATLGTPIAITPSNPPTPVAGEPECAAKPD